MDAQRAEALLAGEHVRKAGRALVIADQQREQVLLVDALAQAGLQAESAADATDALRRARETGYAALTLDLQLPDRRGLALLGDIRSQGASHAAPVLGLSMPAGIDGGSGTQHLGELTGRVAFGVANILCKPIRSDEILLAMAPFRQTAAGGTRVMVIDDEALSLDLMQATLKSIGVDALCYQDGRLALKDLQRHQPVALVLDLMMPDFDGFQVLDALRSLPAGRELPVFIWTSMLLTDAEYAQLARSARAILLKGGGTLEAVLDSLRRWRATPPSVTDGSLR
jgi:DNA-binding response OmpR family regulator